MDMVIVLGPNEAAETGRQSSNSSIEQSSRIRVDRMEIPRFQIYFLIMFLSPGDKSCLTSGRIMIPRPSRGYFFNGRSPSLLATPKGRTHGLPLAMKLLLATRKRVFNVEG